MIVTGKYKLEWCEASEISDFKIFLPRCMSFLTEKCPPLSMSIQEGEKVKGRETLHPLTSRQNKEVEHITFFSDLLVQKSEDVLQDLGGTKLLLVTVFYGQELLFSGQCHDREH